MATSPELLLISAVIRTRDHRALKATGVTPDMFHRYPDEGQWLFDYVAKHSKAPTRAAFRDAFPDVGLKRHDDVDYAAAELRKDHVRNAILTTVDEVIDHMESGDDIAGIVQRLQHGAAEAQTRIAGVSANYDAFADWDSTYQEIVNRVGRVKKNGLAGIPTGFRTLDDVTGGLQPGWFCVVAARLGGAKTWTGIRVAYNAAVSGSRVLYYSLEQSRHQVAIRMHGFAGREMGVPVNPLDLSRGTGFDLLEYKGMLRDFADKMRQNGGQFLINDTSRGHVTPRAIAAGIEKDHPDLVIIDYLTLLKATGDDWKATANLSAELQGICQEYHIPILALSQVNRLGTGKEPPSADNLSQADAIGHDADLVATHARQSDRVLKHRLVKFRHGPDGIVWYSRFDPGKGRYNEISYRKAQELIDQDREVA